ncbi:hypothetical protein [Streptomyces subrutilus]|uniref:hypothetical protein n=1 Tax=Streptomyces subrutilus TaxID=36818 RepID=UPI0033D75E8B
MTLVIELRRRAAASRAVGKPGPCSAGALERIVVDDEFWTAIDKLGRHRLPSLADVDPYGDTVLRGEAVGRMVRKLESVELARLKNGEHEAMTTLLAWGLRWRADRDLLIGFSGD